MFLKHYSKSFLTGDDPFFSFKTQEETTNTIHQEITFEPKHEGFIGIPHGGLPMGLCIDAWRRVGAPDYPVHVRFKFGGSGILIGDSAVFSVETSANGEGPQVNAKVTKVGDKTPYLRAEIVSASETNGIIAAQPSNRFRKLPYYRNCFVCGHHRKITGLQRRFRVHQTDDSWMVTTPWGDDSDDLDRAAYFLLDDQELHPAALISIFDENTAWAGFMVTRSAGLSVKVEFTLMRPVHLNEKLLFVSEPAGIRGNPKSPRFFLAAGKILSLRNPQNPEVVAYGKGEWIILDQYTDQIKTSLLPHDDWAWIFLQDNE